MACTPSIENLIENDLIFKNSFIIQKFAFLHFFIQLDKLKIKQTFIRYSLTNHAVQTVFGWLRLNALSHIEEAFILQFIRLDWVDPPSIWTDLDWIQARQDFYGPRVGYGCLLTTNISSYSLVSSIQTFCTVVLVFCYYQVLLSY